MSAKPKKLCPCAKVLLSRAGIFLFYLILWAMLACAINQPLLLPSPQAVFTCLLDLLPNPLFARTLWGTLRRTLLAYGLGIVTAITLSVLCMRFQLVHALISPLLSAVRATPVTSFIVLALVWLDAPRVPILTGFLMTLPVVYAALVQSIRAVDPRLLEMTKLYHFGRMKTLRFLYIPSVMPAFAESCLASIGLCWKAVVAAEVIGVPKMAVGSKLYEAKIYLETDALLAWTLTVVVLSILLENLLKRLVAHFTEVRHG